jgi:hypothetical protein
MHYEVFRVKPFTVIDSVDMHVSSSKAGAEKWIAANVVAPYSWWQVHLYWLDDDDWAHEGERVYYYSHRGTSLPSAPFTRAVNSYRK